MSSEPLSSGRGADGLWPASDYEKMGMGKQNLFVIYNALPFVLGSPGLLFGLVALFVVTPSDVLDEKLELIKHYGLAPIYFTLFAFQVTFTMLNANLGTARRPTRVNVPDQHVYRVYGSSADQAMVLMNDEGDFGKFNRAQRALANFEESLPLLIAQVLAAAFVFPWTTFMVVVLLGVCRTKGAIDYTAERTKRMTGNMAANALGSCVTTVNLMIGLAALTAKKPVA